MYWCFATTINWTYQTKLINYSLLLIPVVAAAVVGAAVVAAAVVGPTVVGPAVVGANVVGASVVAAPVVASTVVGGATMIIMIVSNQIATSAIFITINASRRLEVKTGETSILIDKWQLLNDLQPG